MKTIKPGIVGAAILLLVSAVPTFAIEGLKISVQCSNVVLSWPSVADETYIVQYRSTLDSSTPWQMLTSSLPAVAGTNLTFFIHSNIVQHPNCGGGSGYSMMTRASTDDSSATTVGGSSQWWSGPMAMRADNPSSAAPLFLYPPGFDLTGFIIFDPTTGESVNGSGYSAKSRNDSQFDGPEPQGGGSYGSDGAGSVDAPETGFYQVVRNGVHVMGVTNLTAGSVSNAITISYEAGNAVGTLQEVYILVDGVRYRGANANVAPNIIGRISVDTSFLENGDHTFQVQAGWLNLDPTDPNNFMFHRTSDSFTLTASNIIYYPDWVDTVSEQGYAAYLAKTTCTNASWQIDIFDVGSNRIQTLTGFTTNGIIEAYWNLIDTNGVARTNINVDPEFSAIITVGDPVQKKTPPQPVPYPFPDHASWAVVYQDTFSFMVNSNMYYNAVYQMGSLGATAGGAYTVFPSYPTNGQTFPIRYMNTNQPINFTWVRSDETALMNLLTNQPIRNFYYNGHGTANSISIFLSSDKISQALKRQPYRFVFLDACSTANGGLPAAFGINYKGMKTLSDFQKDKSRPRAFLGYDRDVSYTQSGSFIDPSTGIAYHDKVRPEVTYFLTNFEFYWYYGYNLSFAIYNAIQDTPYIGPGWQTGDNLQLYGYEFLGLDGYNYKTDWSN